MNNETFLIEEYDLEQAKKACKGIKLENIRNRSVANFLAAKLASKYFADVDVDIESGLYNIQQILERYDISDIYIKDCYIDVRLYFNENEILIPKSHFEIGILPVAYMFIKIGEDLSDGLVTGFIQPENVNTGEEFSGFYKVAEEDMVSYYDIEPLLIQSYVDYPDDIELQVYNYLDNKHDDLASFYKILIAHSDARKVLMSAAKAQYIFKQVKPLNDLDVNSKKTAGVAICDDVTEKSDNSDDELEKQLEQDDFSMILESSEEEGPLVSGLEPNFSEDSDTVDLIFDEDMTLQSFEQEDTLMLHEEDNLLEVDLSENDLIVSDSTVDDITFTDNEFDVQNEESLNLVNDEDQESFVFTTSTTPSIDTIEAAINDSDYDNTDVVDTDEDILLVDSKDVGIEEDEEWKDKELKDYDDNAEEIQIIDEYVETDDIEQQDVIDNKEDEGIVDASIDAYENSELTSVMEIEPQEDENNEEVQSYYQYEKPEGQEEEASEDNDIDYLFNSDAGNEATVEEDTMKEFKPKKQSLPALPLISILVLASAIGYFAYNKIMSNNSTPTLPREEVKTVQNVKVENTSSKQVAKAEPKVTKAKNEAMPNETVENVKSVKRSEEAINELLPNIQSISTPVDISNMVISFEVPSTYLTIPTVKRYFAKIGKVLQLNIKNKLLLSNKSPLTNNIKLELIYNTNSKSFTVGKLINGSGDDSLDSIIKSEVELVLNYEYNINLSSLNDINGNPILVIKF